MQFRHPELLYALFLLVIPFLVHLFQLRKFRKEKFTNVKFLRKASLQTRKSSQIKKWLILCTRLFLLAAVVFAFAQPYIPSGSERTGTERETVIYLDNSYSMQARGPSGVLLRRAVQDLLETLPRETSFSLFTNNAEFRNVTVETIQKDLQQLTYSPTKMGWDAIKLKAGNLFADTPETAKDLIVISDFQENGNPVVFDTIENMYTRIVRMLPENITNINVDSAYVSERTLDKTTLSVRLKASGIPSTEVPVSLYNNDKLIAKKTINLQENGSAETTFEIPSNNFKNGSVTVDDSGLSFDNQLYFSINKTDPIEVVVINNNEDSFLKRIFREPDFNYVSYPENQVDFNKLTAANLIILNELKEISSPLAGTLRNLLQEGVFVSVIPAAGADLQTYNAFFRENALPDFEQKLDGERLITNILYAHPLYRPVFDEKVHNFQYPKVQSSYKISRNETAVLSYANGQPFLFQNGNSFVFTAALNTENSNFQMAPLIVPTLYNIGNLALEPSELYYVLGNNAKVDVNTSLGRDQVLEVASSGYSFIPRQQNFQNKVELTFSEAPEEAGHYSILNDTTELGALSFNIDRRESSLKYSNIEPSEKIAINTAVSDVFEEIKSENETNALWKWFVIFGLLFLLAEMFLLKFLK